MKLNKIFTLTKNNIIPPFQTIFLDMNVIQNHFGNWLKESLILITNLTYLHLLTMESILYRRCQSTRTKQNTYFVSQTILAIPNLPLLPMHYLTNARLDQIAISSANVLKILGILSLYYIPSRMLVETKLATVSK